VDDGCLYFVQVHGVHVFSPEEVQPVLLPLLTNLFAAFSKPESEENPYLMKCVMRVIVFAGPQVQVPYLCLCRSALHPVAIMYVFLDLSA
jgi:hypothetical protein